jgi:hypothetical protein
MTDQSVNQVESDHRPFVDTPLKQAIRRAFDHPTIANIEAVAAVATKADPPVPAALDALPWRCFHCDEVFTDAAEAKEHFGADEWKVPACRLAVDDVQRLRALETQNATLRREVEAAENDARLWYESEADRVRRIGHCQWWQEMDSREGEKLVLQERLAELEAALRAAGPRRTTPDGCINCGEANDGGYMTGREGHVDEGAVGPFCSQCWQLLQESFGK